MKRQSTLDGETPTTPPEILRNISFHYYESQPGVQYLEPVVRDELIGSMMDTIEESANETVDEDVAFDLIDCIEEVLDTASLWMVIEDPKNRTANEFPVYVQSPFGSVCSKDREYSSTSGKELSEEFYKCIADIVSNEVPESVEKEFESEDGWGSVCIDGFEKLNDTEKKFVNVAHDQLVQGRPPREIAYLVQYSKQNYGPHE